MVTSVVGHIYGLTFEDGRTGTISADLAILEAETFGAAEPLKKAG